MNPFEVGVQQVMNERAQQQAEERTKRRQERLARDWRLLEAREHAREAITAAMPVIIAAMAEGYSLRDLVRDLLKGARNAV